MSQDTKSLDALMKRLETPSPAFEAFRDSMPPNYWARYDLSAVRLGWEAASKPCDDLRGVRVAYPCSICGCDHWSQQ